LNPCFEEEDEEENEDEEEDETRKNLGEHPPR
jgi:hypothetical protein